MPAGFLEQAVSRGGGTTAKVFVRAFSFLFSVVVGPKCTEILIFIEEFLAAELNPPLFCKAKKSCGFFMGNVAEGVRNTSLAVSSLLPPLFRAVNLLQCPYVVSSVWAYWKIGKGMFLGVAVPCRGQCWAL